MLLDDLRKALADRLKAAAAKVQPAAEAARLAGDVTEIQLAMIEGALDKLDGCSPAEAVLEVERLYSEGQLELGEAAVLSELIGALERPGVQPMLLSLAVGKLKGAWS